MSFSAYPIYKSSGDEWLSEVPEHWEVLPLKHFAEVDNSGCYGVEPADGDHIRPVATTAQIDSEGRFDVGRMSDRGFSAQELARYECSPGDVLVVKSSGSAENIISGKAGLVREDTPAFVFSNFLMRLRHRKDVCLPSFLYSLLISHLTRERIKQMCSTTTYPNLQVGLYTSAKLPCPPLTEQTQIARFLDHETARIDALIEEQQRLIELLKEKRQAAISHAVTKGLDPTVPMKDSGVEWLGEVPAHWAVCQVRHLMVGDTRNGLYKPEGEKDPDGVGFVQMGEAFRDRIFQGGVKDRVQASNTELKNWGLEEGDLLFARRSIVLEGSGRCTRVGSLNEPHLFESSMIRVRLDLNRVSPEYLHLMFDSIGMRAQVLSTTKTVTISGIDSGQLKGLRVAVPAKSEQENIAAYLLSRIEAFDDAERAAMETTLLLQERRSALISAAVTGKIDVRGWQPPASTQSPELAVAKAN
jgi:type I restriction enzyme S subunit